MIQAEETTQGTKYYFKDLHGTEFTGIVPKRFGAVMTYTAHRSLEGEGFFERLKRKEEILGKGIFTLVLKLDVEVEDTNTIVFFDGDEAIYGGFCDLEKIISNSDFKSKIKCELCDFGERAFLIYNFHKMRPCTDFVKRDYLRQVRLSSFPTKGFEKRSKRHSARRTFVPGRKQMHSFYYGRV